MTTALRVVVAEDDPGVRDSLCRLLREEGIDVVGEGHDGREAVDLALSLEPDVVVMDMGMPVMDGLEATRAIKAQKPSLRIVVLSGSDDRVISMALEAGADACVVKGASVQELLEVLK